MLARCAGAGLLVFRIGRTFANNDRCGGTGDGALIGGVMVGGGCQEGAQVTAQGRPN